MSVQERTRIVGRPVSGCSMSFCERFASSRRHQHVRRSEGSTGFRVHDDEHVWQPDGVNELAIRTEMERRITIYLNRPKPFARLVGTGKPLASKSH